MRIEPVVTPGTLSPRKLGVSLPMRMKRADVPFFQDGSVGVSLPMRIETKSFAPGGATYSGVSLPMR